MKERIIERSEVKALIETSEGTEFVVNFIKKDSSKRTMVAKTGVTEFLKGGTYTGAKYTNLVPVYDVEAEGYRSVNTDTVIDLEVKGILYTVN